MIKLTKKQIFVSALVIILTGSLLHFLYQWLGGWPPIGLIAAVNESLWEHTKLAYVPMTFFWIAYAFHRPKNRAAILAGGAVATLCTIFLIPALFYTFQQGFKLESLVLDILIYSFSVLIGQMLGAYVAHHVRYPLWGWLGGLVFASLILLYSVFTYLPPHLPIFQAFL